MNKPLSEQFLKNMQRLKHNFDTDIATQRRKSAIAAENAKNANKETHEQKRD